MKKRDLFHWAMGVMLTPWLGSCAADDVIGGAGREECDIILGQPITVTSATRATDGSTSSTPFDSGEIVWLWANKSGGSEYIKAWQLKADGNGGFSSATAGNAKYWPSDGSSLNVYALHGNFKNPSITEGTTSWSSLTSLTHTVEADQSTDENKRLSDLLYSHPSSAFAPNSGSVELTFDHLLAKITVKLNLSNSVGITASELSNATVTLTKIQPDATISNTLLTGNSGPTSTTGTRTTITSGKITSSITSGDVIGSAIVPLQNFGGGKSYASQNNVITITLSDGRSFSYKPTANVALSAGREYTYTLTILGKQITGSWSVSDFISATDSISFKDNFDYLADLKNRAYLGSSSDPHDLSCDYNGQMNTANCYVVTHPGYYKFPLVYGNAIKNGATNAIAYGGGTSSTTFVNHLGNQITDPYIYNNSNNNSGKLEANSAALVWQDAQNLISNIGLSSDNHYIQFEITKENIEQGNAVIAVKDESGTIMWSWHIWVTNKNVYETVPIKTVALSGLTSEHTYNFMPVPLGWDDDIPDQPNCPYYQWGRKDPLCPSDGTTLNKDKTLYNSSGNSFTMTRTSGGVSTGTSIQNPTTYYFYKSSPWDWNSTTYYDYWNATNGTTTSMNDNAVVKTVYDPNPVGFKMPSPDAFTGFTNDGSDQSQSSNFNVESTSFNNGWNFYTQGWETGTTDFWRANGYRGYRSGSLFWVGSYGRYWSAGPAPYPKGRYLEFHSSYVGPQYCLERTSGFSVRPVSE